MDGNLNQLFCLTSLVTKLPLVAVDRLSKPNRNYVARMEVGEE